MFSNIFSVVAARAVNCLTAQSVGKNISQSLTKSLRQVSRANFSSLAQNRIQLNPAISPISHLKSDLLQPSLQSHQQIRTVIKFSWKQAERKTVKVVLSKFYRLNCGNWIRTIAGRHKKAWKKTQKRRRRHMEHVFCNKTQSFMLDKMVSYYWRKPKYYINNPYEPYEWRENFPVTQTKPKRPDGVDYE